MPEQKPTAISDSRALQIIRDWRRRFNATTDPAILPEQECKDYGLDAAALCSPDEPGAVPHPLHYNSKHILGVTLYSDNPTVLLALVVTTNIVRTEGFASLLIAKR